MTLAEIPEVIRGEPVTIRKQNCYSDNSFAECISCGILAGVNSGAQQRALLLPKPSRPLARPRAAGLLGSTRVVIERMAGYSTGT